MTDVWCPVPRNEELLMLRAAQDPGTCIVLDSEWSAKVGSHVAAIESGDQRLSHSLSHGSHCVSH